jgi:hypothetical protein
MSKHSSGNEPVGVVPRHRARFIEPLMSDVPEALSVSESVESPSADAAQSSPISRWLSSMAVSAAAVFTLEWLKLTR